MKTTLRILLLAAAVAAAACARHRIIPDEKLAMIFRDAFLVNAYLSTESLSGDSLNVYEPIFDRYGYTVEDVQYTVASFSRRKSARLGDVVNRAADLLEQEGLIYDREVAVLDTVNNIARRRFTRTLRSDSLLRVERLRDTGLLRIRIPEVRPGDYAVSYRYRIDSADRNRNVRTGVWFERADSSRTANYTMLMRRGSDETFSRTLTADSSARTLVLDIFIFRDKPLTPRIDVRDLRITFTPDTALAVDSLYLEQSELGIFADEFFQAFAPDSLQLPL
ncbi:MAG: DUF4296 domain-containing protein [Alistipes sp.]|jgi:hypothetical protein|uniref:DUF4296 domain-containing protein n=1 Tax=Alistipes sp. TaxID=1872444 RepID=UPI0011CC369B|nr:DUF4296 domain-containing protein [Alistipes sp.]MBS6099120.1 DUF4296 domain-containing protein [Alistipes sp.]HJI19969.1 DUF4296 domain-containing protein [Rikenellaceae bacterium]